MVLEYIEKTVAAIQSAGVEARRAFPAEKMPHLTELFATVSIHKASQSSVALLVTVYAPVTKGGNACEDGAVTIARALEALGGQWKIGSCSFESKAGVFALPVEVTYPGVGAAR